MKRTLRLLAALLLTAATFAACSSPATDEQPNAAEADAGDDADTGEPDADVPDDADGGGEEDADTNGNDVCEPDCSGLQCGEDPECGESCGECDGIDVCDDGQCVEADTHATWELDGEVVYQTVSVGRKRYRVSEDLTDVRVTADTTFLTSTPWIEVTHHPVSERNELSISCDEESDREEAHTTIDTGTQTPSNFPSEWHHVVFSQNYCDNSLEDGDDELETWVFDITETTDDRFVGEFSIEILGAGPREGSTLKVYGEINVDLEQE